MGDSDSDMKWGSFGKTGEFEKSCKEILFWLRNKEIEEGKIMRMIKIKGGTLGLLKGSKLGEQLVLLRR